MKLPCFEKSCASNPELVKIWHIENELKPEQVYLKSGKKFKWNCLTCNHIYEQKPDTKYRENTGCPYCSKPPQKLCKDNNCKDCLNKTCASKYLEIWNDELDPRHVFLQSNIKIKWKCNKCKHNYEQRPNDKFRGQDCPYCAIPSRVLCGNCEQCINKSCASKYLEIWNDKLDPKFVFLGYDKLINWKCLTCKHTYLQPPDNKRRGDDCPYCSNHKLCNEEKCKDCFNKSCASNENMVKIWNDKLLPRDIFLKSGKKIKWKCIECNNTYLQCVREKFNGNGCPNCKYKTEKKVKIFLNSKNIKIKTEFKLSNDTKKYDILCKDYNVIIEIDGRQHFKDVKLFKSTAKENQENDKNKMIKAMEQGYSFIRIFQEDIWNDKFDWKNLILDNLNIRSSPNVLYFSSIETLYDNHQLI